MASWRVWHLCGNHHAISSSWRAAFAFLWLKRGTCGSTANVSRGSALAAEDTWPNCGAELEICPELFPNALCMSSIGGLMAGWNAAGICRALEDGPAKAWCRSALLAGRIEMALILAAAKLFLFLSIPSLPSKRERESMAALVARFFDGNGSITWTWVVNLYFCNVYIVSVFSAGHILRLGDAKCWPTSKDLVGAGPWYIQSPLVSAILLPFCQSHLPDSAADRQTSWIN